MVPEKTECGAGGNIPAAFWDPVIPAKKEDSRGAGGKSDGSAKQNRSALAGLFGAGSLFCCSCDPAKKQDTPHVGAGFSPRAIRTPAKVSVMLDDESDGGQAESSMFQTMVGIGQKCKQLYTGLCSRKEDGKTSACSDPPHSRGLHLALAGPPAGPPARQAHASSSMGRTT